MNVEASIVSRRRFLASGLATAAALKLGPRAFALANQRCVLTAEQEMGPYYVRDEMVRSNITEGRAGVPLHVRVLVSDQATCQPLRHAAIDLWHCDALGLYSGFTAMKGFGGPGGHGPGEHEPGEQGDGPPPPGGGLMGDAGGPPPGTAAGSPPGPPPGAGPGGSMHLNKPTDKLTFLRGIQITDGEGVASFDTVFPGVYQGRTNHIHFKVRLDGHLAGKTYAAGHVSHCGQIFFPEDLNVRLMAEGPYTAHAIHRTTMEEDHVYNAEHGALAVVRPVHAENPSLGLVAEFHAAVDPRATPAAVGMGFGPPRGRRQEGTSGGPQP